MPRRTRWLLACLLVLLLAVIWRWSRWLGSRTPEGKVTETLVSPDRPNVLLISLDTVRPDHLGCYGYTKGATPNLDRFAQTAIRFSQARAQAPWTVPSHMSLFTSLLPIEHQIDTVPMVRLSPQIPTLAEALRGAGYRTAAIVANGGMDPEWGFDRGYENYQHFPARQPEGQAESITAKAMAWLAAAPRQPWHLFIHYFDAHDPYHSPEPFHQRFGALPPEAASKVLFDHLTPAQPFEDPNDLARLMASYDAGLAHLDAALAPLLDHLPPHTIVVIFSDHGEAFKEHGWTWHYMTLYEEEIRAVLLMRFPPDLAADGAGAPPPLHVVDEPVMLIDVAPTILLACGIRPPPTFAGWDLHRILGGGRLPKRFTSAETKTTDGQFLKCLVLPPWKLIYDMYDGSQQLYRLPDEHTNLITSEPAKAQEMMETMRPWVDREQYWMIYFTGPGRFKASMQAVGGQIAAGTPVNFTVDEHKGFLTKTGEGVNSLEWVAQPGPRVQAVCVRVIPPDAPLLASFDIDGQRSPRNVFVGLNGTHPSELPSEFSIGTPITPPVGKWPRMMLGEEEISSPVVDRPFLPQQPGFYLRRFGSAQNQALPAVPRIDPKRLEELRSLGYMR